jgi:hypothetical protein
VLFRSHISLGDLNIKLVLPWGSCCGGVNAQSINGSSWPLDGWNWTLCCQVAGCEENDCCIVHLQSLLDESIEA